MAKRPFRPFVVASNPTPKQKPTMRVSYSMLLRAAQPMPRTTPWKLPAPAPGVLPPGASMAMDSSLSSLYDYAANSYGDLARGGMGLEFLGYPFLAELSQIAEYRRMANTLAQEMTREWCRITSTGDNDKSAQIKVIEKAMIKYRVREIFREAAEMDALFGKAHIYIDVGGWMDKQELATPLFPTPMKVMRGGLRRIKTIEPIWTSPGPYDSSNPLSESFYRPDSWYLMGDMIHRSRLLTLVSREVPDILKPAYTFGGISLSALARPYIEGWHRTRRSVSDLLHSFTTWNLQTNMQAALAGGAGDDLITRAQLFAELRDNRGMMITDKETEALENISVPLGGLDALQSQAQEQMCSVDGMPLVILLGLSPHGLNATAEPEMDAWRNRIRAQQEHLFNAPLQTILDFIQVSELGEVDPEIGFEWNDLVQEDPLDQANVRKAQADTAQIYINTGVISPDEERGRLAGEDESDYQNLDLTLEITPPAMQEAQLGAEQEQQQAAGVPLSGMGVPHAPSPAPGAQQPVTPPRPAIQAPVARPRAANDGLGLDDWQESEHPRGQPKNAGEFASKGGGGGSGRIGAPAPARTSGESYKGGGAAPKAPERDKFEEMVEKYHARMKMLHEKVDRDGLLYADETRYPGRSLTLTKSTRPGVAWQVTSWNGDEPVGHRDYDHLESDSPANSALQEFADESVVLKESEQPEESKALPKFFTPEDNALPPSDNVKQKFTTQEAIFSKARTGLDDLKEWLDKNAGVAIESGYRNIPKAPEQVTSEEWAQPGGMLFIAPLKGEDRSKYKVEKEYKGDWSSLKDVVRCTLATESLGDLTDIIAKLKSSGMKLANRPKNRFEKPTDAGYRDILLNVELPNGLIGEVQLNTKAMMRAKNEGHKLYEEQRTLDPKQEDGTATPDELARLSELKDMQKKLYGDAWEESQRSAQKAI